MKPESLVQLVGSGNTGTVEEEWMRLIEAPDVPLPELTRYACVLAEFSRVGRSSEAEALAWAAIETISTRHTPLETLPLAGELLLAIGESDELRTQVAELYRSAYSDREGVEELLAESGLGGGRPVRRALRTLDVCLALRDGDFLVARDEDAAVRVDGVDTKTWEFTVTGVNGAHTLGAVKLADRYMSASRTEFAVMRVFARDELVLRLWDDPASVIIDICKQRDNGMESEQLEALLSPDLVPEADWKKWWTRARTALRRCPHIKIDGRSPFQLSYIEVPVALEDGLLREFDALRDPLAQLDLVEKYLRECKLRNQRPSESALRQCCDSFTERAKAVSQADTTKAGLAWMIAAQAAKLAGANQPLDGAVDLFRASRDLRAIFSQLENEILIDLACEYLAKARPDDWPDQVLALLPTFPAGSCDRASARLVEAGRRSADFEPVVQEIFASPVQHFEGLLWLWDGPSAPGQIPVPAPVTLLSRILRALHDCRQGSGVHREVAKKVGGRARAVLSARKYEKFDRCLEGLDAGMGNALRRQIRQLDNLGRAVREDLSSRLSRRFPPTSVEPATQPWERDDVLYVTEAGLTRKQEEIAHHVNVKMRENSIAIGRAASHGDLSENSEYKFALEERDLLRARLAQMNSEVAAARVLAPDDVPTNHVGIGTVVTLRRVADGEPYDIAILGPWESDLDSRRLNYRTPVAKKILGKKVGDTVEFDHTGAAGTYEIVALHSALAASE